jgi:hypothetical protein
MQESEPTEIKLAIVGNRPKSAVVKYEFVRDKIDELMIKHNLKPILIISGGADGIDKHAKDYAKEKGIELLEHKPDYDKYPGYLAPLMRNDLIARDNDVMIAFWNQISKGTKDVTDKQTNLDKDLIIVKI